MNNNEINPLDCYTIVFKALSDITRLKIMWLLFSIDSKISASEIIDVLEENQYNVSKHLRILKNAGLIYEKKNGKWTFYHYRSGNDVFDKTIRKAVLTIPAEFLVQETDRCTKRLSMRVDGTCVVGAASEQWNNLINK